MRPTRSRLVLLAPLLLGTAFGACDCDDLLGSVPEPTAVLVHGDDEAPPLPLLEVGFGAVAVSTTAELTIDVRNDGDATLHVENVVFVADAERCAQPSGAFTIAAPPAGGQPPARAFEVKPGEKQAITIRFTPSSGQPSCTVVEVQSDDRENPALRALVTGQGDAAQLCTDRAVVDFGEVFLGQSKDDAFTLTSCGTKPITIQSVALNDQFPPFSTGELPQSITLDPGQSLPVPVRFAPTEERVHSIAAGTSGVLTFATDQENQSYRVDLVGSARRPPSCVVSVVPGVVNFGTVAEGRSSTQTVLVRNIGELDCTITSIEVRAPQGSFSAALVDITPGATLPPLTTASVEVTFAPSAIAGVENGFLDVVSSDPVNPTLSVPLEGNSVELQPCMLEAQPTGLNFGVQTLNRSVERVVTLTNIGSETCSVKTLTITSGGSEFVVVTQTFPFVGSPLTSGGSMEVVVTFRPTSVGPKAGNLRIAYNEAGFSFPPAPQQTLDVPLTGDGAAPCIAVTPQDVDFGNVAVNATADQQVSVRNCGAAGLSLRGLQLRPGSHPDFRLPSPPPLPAEIAPGASVNVTVRAAPTPAGTTQGGAAMYGALEVLSDLPPEGVALRANAPACLQGLVCQPVSLQFGDVVVGQDLVRAVTCQNPGTQPIAISPAVGAPFSIVAAPAAIPPGGSGVVSVRFEPAAPGPASSTLTLGANGCDGAAVTVAVAGRGADDELPACPAPTAFAPQVEWTWTGAGSPEPQSKEIWVTPLVSRLEDTTGDGLLTRDDMPRVVFASFDKDDFPGFAELGADAAAASDPVPAILRALDGATGAHVWSVTNPEHAINSSVTPAVADIDGDGFVEIIAQRWILLEGVEAFPNGPKILGKFMRGNLIAFEHDGTFKWISDEWTRSQNEIEDGAGPAVGDVDGDGFPEIAVGDHLFDSDGRLLWRGGKGTGSMGHGPSSVLVDLDGQPGLELLAGSTAYRKDGTVLWDKTAEFGFDGLSAAADLDGDGDNEVVFRTLGAAPGPNGSTHQSTALYVLDAATGARVAGPVFPPRNTSQGDTCVPPEEQEGSEYDRCDPIPSNVAIMDVDGDGDREIVLANTAILLAYDKDLVEVWRAQVWDGSGASGPVGFDFEADGRIEAVYNDESKVRAYDQNGTAIYEAGYISRTINETVAIADLDLDGHANLVIGSNEPELGASQGLQMLSNTGVSWAQARGIWNQHAYVEDLVSELGAPLYDEAGMPALQGFRTASAACVP